MFSISIDWADDRTKSKIGVAIFHNNRIDSRSIFAVNLLALSLITCDHSYFRATKLRKIEIKLALNYRWNK